MWRRLASGLIVAGLMALTPGLAAAHVLKTDNGVSAVLHIPPEDNPVAGQATELEVSFGDIHDAFSLADCHCSVTVQLAGRTLTKTTPQPALAGATLDSVAVVRFPNPAVYNVIVAGSSRDGAFPHFRLVYPVRVISKTGTNNQRRSAASEEVLIISAASLIVLGMVAVNAIRTGGRYKEVRHDRKKT
ncbi:MAG TPA: hypothetical protein VG992_00950 [Candidatus Saccharimonadales bacterium]|nr:hypothetical protein [Candidatus Saccharimonadales bacterium]